MGRLTSDQRTSFDIDDHIFAHLRIVVMNELRRNESFMLQVPAEYGGHLSIWRSPSSPLALHFYGGRPPRIDREVVDNWMTEASGPDGLTLPVWTS